MGAVLSDTIQAVKETAVLYLHLPNDGKWFIPSAAEADIKI